MKAESDPLDIVRESRIKISHEASNDPSAMIAALRKKEVKYAVQINKYQLMQAKVAEESVKYSS